MSKKFTVWQLFSVVDGRLSTKMDDVYEILNTASGDSLMTHHLPVASDYFKETCPKWYADAKQIIDQAKTLPCGNDFLLLKSFFEAAEKHDRYPKIEVTTIPDSEKQAFGQYMLKNSLLLKKAV